MSAVQRAFWWRSCRNDLPAEPSWQVVDELTFAENEDRVTGGARLPEAVPAWADDLFRVARAAYLADKHVLRDEEPDRWSRRFRLSVPVREPELWHAPPVEEHLTALLEHLTGDRWVCEFRRLKVTGIPEVLPTDDRATEVSLFSGGLDSLSWVAERVRRTDAGPLLLVCFKEDGFRGPQRSAFDAVQRLADRPVELIEVSQTPSGRITRAQGSSTHLATKPGHTYEYSSRTRGLLYIAGAVRAAAAHGVRRVAVPENGQVALNPALSTARSAACSTRSVHPLSMYHMNGVLDALGGTVEVHNPLLALTKGEVCRRALDAGLTRAQLAATRSCGKPSGGGLGSAKLANCGVCFPCLLRRSGLAQCEGEDRTTYLEAPWEPGRRPESREDWRALLRWLHTPYRMRALIADTPLPPGYDRTHAMNLITRGRHELTTWLSRLPECGLVPESDVGGPG